MSQRNRVQWRLIGLVAAMLFTGLGIGLLTLKSQWRAEELRARVSRVDSESFRIADQFADLLRQLNDLMYNYGRSHVTPDSAAFNKASHELDLWIDQQKPKLTTAAEKALIQQIDSSYDAYLQAAKELLVRLEVIGEGSAAVDEYTALREKSQQLFDLGNKLSRAHLESRNLAVSYANRTIMGLRVLVFISLGLLFVFALALGAVVYRGMILPLRLKLVESESLRDRQEKLASLGVLAAGVAHEIRNPLTAIKGVIFLQQKELQPDSKEYSDVKLIEREILRLERIVSDFLLFARPGESKLALTTADKPLREVHELLAPEMAGAGIQLVLDGLPPLPARMDVEKIKQVLLNLVRNAAEAVGQHGVIKLRARSGSQRLARKETHVVILEVEDNGKGMSAEVQKRLFDPFFTTKETGTGLGLSIALRIVQGHGGVLEYQTAPGLGTTFGIVLPAPVGQTAPSAD